MVPAGRPGTPETKGPRSRDKTGQDLETLKVPWSRDSKSPKVPGLKNWKSPGTMETLLSMSKKDPNVFIEPYHFRSTFFENFHFLKGCPFLDDFYACVSKTYFFIIMVISFDHNG